MSVFMRQLFHLGILLLLKESLCSNLHLFILRKTVHQELQEKSQGCTAYMMIPQILLAFHNPDDPVEHTKCLVQK